MTARKNVLDTIRAAAEQVGNQRYFVKRGAINWPDFNFEEHGSAIAIIVEDETIYGQMRSMKISLEVATRMARSDQEPSIDDGEIDNLHSDIVHIINELIRAKDKKQDSVATGVNQKNIRAVEFHDPGMLVQGVMVSMEVKY